MEPSVLKIPHSWFSSLKAQRVGCSKGYKCSCLVMLGSNIPLLHPLICTFSSVKKFGKCKCFNRWGCNIDFGEPKLGSSISLVFLSIRATTCLPTSSSTWHRGSIIYFCWKYIPAFGENALRLDWRNYGRESRVMPGGFQRVVNH